MKIAIMQPYFMPYIGYWQLMNAVDKYVIYDDVNYIKRGWISRNRILINGKPTFFHLPVIGVSQNKFIYEVRINHEERLIKKNLYTVEYAYKKAPFFKSVYPLIERILYCKQNIVSEYIKESFYIICEYLGITTELIVSSTIDKDPHIKGQDKLISICKTLGATEYYNAFGGMELYSFAAFKENGIKLKFLKTGDVQYRQYGNPFQSNLSIIDVMMFNSKEKIKKILGQYTIITD